MFIVMLYRDVMSVGSTAKKLTYNHCGHGLGCGGGGGVNFSQSTKSMNVFLGLTFFKKVLKRIQN